MKKILVIMIMIVLNLFTLNVYAVNTAAKDGEDNYNNLFTEANRGIPKFTVNGTETITLYGYSDCQSNRCTYKYSNTSSDFKDVLKSAITCANGEKYINYQTTSTNDIWYKSGIENGESISGRVAWSEDFSITCTNTETSNTLALNNTTQQPTNTPSGGSNNDNNENNNVSNNGSNTGGFGSSTTTENESQGVGTYYVILVIVGFVTYLLTILVKKQNLFKKV